MLALGLSIPQVGLGGPGAAPSMPDRPYPAYPETVLADLSRVSKINDGGSIANLTDETTDGRETVRWQIPNAIQRLVPSVFAPPVDMSGGKGSIVISERPVAQLGSDGASPSLFRHALELYSGTNATQTTNYHRSDPNSGGSDVKARSTTASPSMPGALSTYSIALPHFTAVGSGAAMSAVTGARLWAQCSLADAVMNVERIAYRPNPRSKAALIFRLDDLHKASFDYAVASLGAHGFPAAVAGGAYQALIGQPGYCSVNDLKMVKALPKPWQIMGQAWSTENISGWDAAMMTSEMQAMKAWYRATIADDDDMLDGTYFSSMSQTNQVLGPAMRAQFRTLSCAYNGNDANPPTLHGETFPFGDRHRIRCFNLGMPAWGTNASSRALSLLAQAKAGNGVMMVYVHDELAAAGNVRTAWDDLVSAAATDPAVEVTTVRDMLFAS